MSKRDVAAWVEGYVRAWTRNDPQESGALFAGLAPDCPSPSGEAGYLEFIEWWRREN